MDGSHPNAHSQLGQVTLSLCLSVVLQLGDLTTVFFPNLQRLFPENGHPSVSMLNASIRSFSKKVAFQGWELEEK